MNKLNFLLRHFYCLSSGNFIDCLDVRIQREECYDLCNEMVICLIVTEYV
jgi:hypothetical protein